MQNLLKILDRPYPLELDRKSQIKQAAVFGLVVGIVIFLINVFNNNFSVALKNGVWAGLFTFLVIELDYLFFFYFFSSFFNEEKWNIGREIIWALIIIVSIATANILVTVILGKAVLSFYAWAVTIFYTALIGIFPVAASIIINQYRLLKKYRLGANAINDTLKISAEKNIPELEEITKTETNDVLIIPAENEKDQLSIPVESFLVAMSADNYVKVFYLLGDKLNTKILRTTLKNLESNAVSFPAIFRCHRTAVVNLNAVENLSGTAQGYRLKVQFLSEEIPVSRNLNKAIKEKLATVRP